jgi:hypothetical protein
MAHYDGLDTSKISVVLPSLIRNYITVIYGQYWWCSFSILTIGIDPEDQYDRGLPKAPIYANDKMFF